MITVVIYALLFYILVYPIVLTSLTRYIFRRPVRISRRLLFGFLASFVSFIGAILSMRLWYRMLDHTDPRLKLSLIGLLALVSGAVLYMLLISYYLYMKEGDDEEER